MLRNCSKYSVVLVNFYWFTVCGLMLNILMFNFSLENQDHMTKEKEQQRKLQGNDLFLALVIYIKTAFTRCRHILKTMKNVTVAKFELAFTRCRNNLKTVGNLTLKLVARL